MKRLVRKTILIQGALEEEIEYLIEQLEDKKLRTVFEYEFYDGYIRDKRVVVSKTLVGTINSTLATMIGILTFEPNIIINQGIAGAHREDLHIGDIIIGEKCVNINAYKMPVKEKGEGSDPFLWELNKRAKEIYSADSSWVDILEKELISERVYKGILGSGDVFNREYDRIKWIHNTFHNLCEDMESLGTYSVCNKFGMPCIGVRIISNNELLHEEMNKSVSLELQKQLLSIINKL